MPLQHCHQVYSDTVQQSQLERKGREHKHRSRARTIKEEEIMQDKVVKRLNKVSESSFVKQMDK